jgi:hypothetical protein
MVMQPISLLARDVGFDPRTTGHLVRIEYIPVRYMDGAKPTVTTTRDVEAIGEELARAGYSVVVAATTNGRDIQCTPQTEAPAGDWPKRKWTGPAWAVQARGDNYWCVGPSLTAVLTSSGWKNGEITALWSQQIHDSV